MDISFKEFDDKLGKCLEKIREKKNLENADEIAAIYQRSAVNFRELIKKNNEKSLLGLANQTFDNLLNEQSNDEVNEKFLKRVDSYGNEAMEDKVAAIMCSFLSVATLVAGLLFAIPTSGLSLICLIYTVEAGAFAYLGTQQAKKISEETKTYESFARSNQGLFSSDYLTDKQPQGSVVQNPMQPGDGDDKGTLKK